MIKSILLSSAYLAGAAVLFSPALSAHAKVAEPTIAIEEIAARPVITSVSVSPDGKRVAYRVAQSREGDYAIEVRDLSDISGDPVRLGSKVMNITGFRWIGKNQLLVDFVQQTGDQVKQQNVGTFQNNSAIMNADGSGRPVELFPDLRLIAALPDDPNHVIVRTNRQRALTMDELKRKSMTISSAVNPDYYRMNVRTGAMRKYSSPDSKNVFFHDGEGNPVMASEYRADRGGDVFYVRMPGSDSWNEIGMLPDTDMTAKVYPLGFHPTKDDTLLVSSNITPSGVTEYAQVYEVSMSGDWKKLWSLDNQDVTGAVYNPRSGQTNKVVGFNYWGDDGKPRIQWLSRAEKNRYEQVKGIFPDHDIFIGGADTDGDTYSFFARKGAGIGSQYVVDGGNVIPLGPVRGVSNDVAATDQMYITYPSKDGTMIPAYVTLPKVGKAPYPAIVMPHGGPYVEWRPYGFDEWSQFLASNGYAVIDPLFRGTEGLGRKFLAEGHAEWGQRMNDDMDAAIPYLAEKGIIDADKVAMFGWSHGGYASIAAAMRSPQVYQCTIPGAAVADLGQQNSGFADGRRARRFLGATYKGLNPIENVDKVSVPMLLIHGELDQRVMREQSDAFAKKLEDAGKPFKYVVLEKADHFNNTLSYDNRVEMYEAMTDFLKNDCGM